MALLLTGSPSFREVRLEERRSLCRLKQSAADAHPPTACPRHAAYAVVDSGNGSSCWMEVTWIITPDPCLILELTIVREGKRHDGDAFHRLRSVPGIGNVLAFTILEDS